MTDTLLKYYIHSLDLSERLRNELEFSDPERIRMYSDNERLGVRLKPTKYNTGARKPEFPNSVIEFSEVTGTMPPDRFWSDIAYDSNRKVHVLYGGMDATFSVVFNDTWEFNAATDTWTQVFPANNPGLRAGHRMIFDDSRNVVVFYGGTDGSTIYGETWEYNGTDWTQVNPVDSPGGRIDNSMAWDSGRQRIVLYGGEGSTFGTHNNDTWEYDGTNWVQVVTADSPDLRRHARIDYDKRRNVVVLWGGVSPSIVPYFWPPFRDTWEYNGTNWTKKSTKSAPGSRVWNGQYYDEATGLVVVHGGLKHRPSAIGGGDFDYTDDGYYTDAWGYDGNDWVRIDSTNFPSRMTVDHQSYDTDLCKSLLWLGTDSFERVYFKTFWMQATNLDISCRLPTWSPQAVKSWEGFEESTERESGLIVHWRVSDGTSDYWFNGSAWVVASLACDWNSDIEVSENIGTFPHTQKRIQFVCRLVTLSRWATPVVFGTRLLMTASFDWFEDLILRSLVPRMEQDFSFLMDWSGVLEAATDRFNIKTDYPFTPEEDLNVTGIEAVFNEDTDPNYETDLLQSFDPNTGEAVLTGTLPAGTRLFYRLEIVPEVAVNFTNTDYDEIGKTPTIIIDQIGFDGKQVSTVADMALKDRSQGAKLAAPLWVEAMNLKCALITGKTVNSFRLMTKAYSFVIRGTTEITDHKPGGILKTKALDLEHTLKIVPVSRYNPKSNFSDLKEASFGIIVCDFYAWLRDMETTPLVTRFNPSVSDMRDVGTGNPNDEKQTLPAGAIPALFRTPEVEEV